MAHNLLKNRCFVVDVNIVGTIVGSEFILTPNLEHFTPTFNSNCRFLERLNKEVKYNSFFLGFSIFTPIFKILSDNYGSFLVHKESEFAGVGITWYFLSNSRDITVCPAGMGNTHKSRDFANPV